MPLFHLVTNGEEGVRGAVSLAPWLWCRTEALAQNYDISVDPLALRSLRSADRRPAAEASLDGVTRDDNEARGGALELGNSSEPCLEAPDVHK